ncbi:PREDICTED: cyclin-Y-like protein 1 [Miniopterus natalensis]|uniref:cyclin-Y-like protein 1 n=1 Tax=Miniopterus natalensis TaxID=291302 RepID=UPI0007A6D2E2|nr:PREDICTED: cyclin-Y-like protein 1 [Miniopterus natalensis]
MSDIELPLENTFSDHPRASTIFFNKSAVEVQEKRNNYLIHEAPGCLTKKYSSCSTIFLDDSTVSQPNFGTTVKCVTLAIYDHIKNRAGNRSLDVFDERSHSLIREMAPEEYFEQDPEPTCVYRFARPLFRAMQMTANSAIVTLIYIERLLMYAEIDICPTNWKKIVLGAVLLASEFWEDRDVWIVNYCQPIKDIITVEDMNEMEREFFRLIQHHISVSAGVFAKCYFKLRCVASDNHLPLVSTPLHRERAQNLKAISRFCEDKDLCRATIKRSLSEDNFIGIRGSKTILS